VRWAKEVVSDVEKRVKARIDILTQRRKGAKTQRRKWYSLLCAFADFASLRDNHDSATTLAAC